MKNASKILMTMGLVVLFSGFMFAQGTTPASSSKDNQKAQTFSPGKFVDNNKNGICDNHESVAKAGKGVNFVDKDGDGKCDNCGTTCKGNKKGNCCGVGNGCGKGQGAGCGKGQGAGCGKGQGQQHRHGCTQDNSTTPAVQSKDKTK